jgi:hypothetical protein
MEKLQLIDDQHPIRLPGVLRAKFLLMDGLTLRLKDD